MKADLVGRTSNDVLPWSGNTRTNEPTWLEVRDKYNGWYQQQQDWYQPLPDVPLRRRRMPDELYPPKMPVVACIRCGMEVPDGFTYNGICGACEIVRMRQPLPDVPTAKPRRNIPTPPPVNPEVQPSPIGTGKRAFTND